MFGALFALAAIVQWNDPDPLRWVVMYAAASIVCLSPRRGRLGVTASWLVSAVAMFWSVQLVPDALGVSDLSELTASMAVDRPEVEAAREVMGLVIVGIWMAGAGVRGQWEAVSTDAEEATG
jgi:hypothetical protein